MLRDVALQSSTANWQQSSAAEGPTCPACGTPLILRARLAWAHDFVDTPSLNAAFQVLPLSNFTVFGAPIPHDSGLASIGADW